MLSFLHNIIKLHLLSIKKEYERCTRTSRFLFSRLTALQILLDAIIFYLLLPDSKEKFSKPQHENRFVSRITYFVYTVMLLSYITLNVHCTGLNYQIC